MKTLKDIIELLDNDFGAEVHYTSASSIEYFSNIEELSKEEDLQDLPIALISIADFNHNCEDYEEGEEQPEIRYYIMLDDEDEEWE